MVCECPTCGVLVCALSHPRVGKEPSLTASNLIGDVAATTGADADVILQAIGADSRVGPKYLRPGYGFGGKMSLPLPGVSFTLKMCGSLAKFGPFW